MHEDTDRFDTGEGQALNALLADVVAAASNAAVPPGAQAARARGRRRRTRRTLALTALPIAIVAAGTAAGLGLTGSSKNGHSPLPAVTGTAPASVVASPPSNPTPTASSPSPSSTGLPTISLQTPPTLAQAALNQVALTVTNPGPAATDTVTLSLGTPTAATPYSKSPDEQAVAERLDPATGSWVQVPVHFVTQPAGAWTDQATFTLSLPAHADVTQQLRLIPVGVTGTVNLGVQLSDASHAPVTASYPLALTPPTLNLTGPGQVTTGQTSGDFTVTLTNPTSASYTGVQLHVQAVGATPNCTVNSFPTVQWSTGGTWHSTDLTTASGWPVIDTVSLTPGQTVQLQLRLPVPATLPSCLTRGRVSVIASNIPGLSAVGSASTLPSLMVSSDSPFFTVRHT